MEQRPEQPPEGKLIADAAARMKLSIREAARRAGISYGRWRQIVQGYQNVSPGQLAIVHDAPALTVARMATVVGLSPDRMETEGQRPDVAELMRSGGASLVAPIRKENLPPVLQSIDLQELAGTLEQVDKDIAAFRPWEPGYEADTWANPDLSLDGKRVLIALYRNLRYGGAAGSGRARSGLSPPAAAPSHRRGGAALSPAAV